MEMLVRTPWTSSQPSLALNVDVDKRQLPVVVQLKAVGPDQNVVIDVDAAVDSIRSFVTKTNGQFHWFSARVSGSI